MRLYNSHNLKNFKREIGQANHYLITILVGLDGIKDGIVDKKESFSTSWDPKDRKSSADRSRLYAIKAAMAWIVDNLDMYLRMCNEEPKLIQKKTLQSDFDNSGQSVSMKKLSKALVICIAGNTIERLKSFGLLESMEKVMLGDRIFDRADDSKMIILDGTSKHDMELRERNWERHLRTAYIAGYNL